MRLRTANNRKRRAEARRIASQRSSEDWLAKYLQFIDELSKEVVKHVYEDVNGYFMGDFRHRPFIGGLWQGPHREEGAPLISPHGEHVIRITDYAYTRKMADLI